MTKTTFRLAALAGAALAACHPAAQAFTFQTESIKGNFDSTVSVGTGIRMRDPDVNLIVSGAGGNGAPTGNLSPASSLGDQGNLNYGKGDRFTTYLKGSHELLLKMPSDVTVLARANWVRDFSSTSTTGYTAFGSTTAVEPINGGLSEAARRDLRFKARLLDLWVSKSFDLGEQRARIRVGNQVINWGESLFLPGGINSTNAVDIMRLSQPGVQLKEAVLPAPMVSFATGLGHGLNFEAYVQTHWNANYFPPTGSYWSVFNGLGKGDAAYGFANVHPRNGGQWGASLRYQPQGTQLNLGLYALNYHDKGPQVSTNVNGTGLLGWTYAQDRKLYGVSANFPVGDWAIGTELSFRPRDAVALNANVDGCAANAGNCWVDEKRYQWHVTALYSATPGNARGLLGLLGADTATLLAEAVVIRYPSLRQNYGGELVSAGGWGWGQEFSTSGTPVAVSGRTPNVAANFMQGAKSANLIVSFIQNPANWQASINYAFFRGGRSVFDQPLRDRDFIGLNLSRNF